MHDWAELRHFRYLLAILDKQGFRAAADDLRTSQPNLSIQAKQFQENASIRLFRRLKNGRVRPTETGIAFRALARVLLETRDEVIDALIAIERGEITSVRFGCTPLVDKWFLKELCDRHREILPSCPVRPTHGDAVHLVDEVVSGSVDAAVVTMPVAHPDLHIEELRRERLVVCLRRDHILAGRASIQLSALRENLTIFYHPQRHPAAHRRLVELLHSVGVEVNEFSSASHPSELQSLVKEGHGFALIREGMSLDEELTTRPIEGIDWTVDTALIYHRTRHPKTIAILARRLSKSHAKTHTGQEDKRTQMIAKKVPVGVGGSPIIGEKVPVQMKLIG